jgi:drug/metabolite transporter (DMT)-like permease
MNRDLLPDHPSQRTASFVMTASALLFGVMAILAKLAAHRLPAQQIAFIRFAVGCLICAAAATKVKMRINNWRGLFWRGAFGGAAVACYFASISHLTIGLATLLNYTSPVFTALFAWTFLGERIGGQTIGALAVTSAGIGMVIAGEAPAGSVMIGTWQLVGMLAAVLSGAAVTWIRETRKTDGSWEIFASFCVGGALITGGPAIAHWMPPTPMEWLVLAAVGVTSVIAQLLMTWSLRDLRAAAAGILFQLTPVSALVLGRIFFDERPPPLALVGAAITLGGVGWGAWLGSVKKPRAAAETPRSVVQ